MKSARFIGSKKVAIEDVPAPTPGKGEVLLEVDYCGLCGSERPQYEEGYHQHQGHELVGTVIANGPGANARIGAKAAVYLTRFCGKCEMCQQGLTTLCTTITSKENIGWAWPGGFAEQVVAPEENLMYLEPGVDAKMGVLLLDTLGTPFHGLRAVNAAEAKAAFVAGCGAVGLGVICVLKSLGIPKVYASDRPGFRLNEAEKFGAIPIDITKEDPVAVLDAIGGVDVAVEAAGIPPTLQTCIRVVKGNGRVLALGEQPETFELTVDLTSRLKDLSIHRTWYFPLSEWKENVKLASSGFFKQTDRLVTHVFPLEKMQEAADVFYSGQAVKVLVTPKAD
ncbi:MAG TPA: alcohol dehydrogenase catalytic domain-containing protein [Firmicutes bacterium]|nr:alcohol dehydrogenase catalytic domain-containing protein [Bacillota bacterium]